MIHIRLTAAECPAYAGVGVRPVRAPRPVGRCPACDGPLEIRRLQCPACDTAVEGHFVPSPYAALTAEQASFLEAFLRARGNLREVERLLGLSYPTLRGRLDAVLEALGFADDPPGGEPDPGRRGVLEALRRGEISAAEAAARIRGAP